MRVAVIGATGFIGRHLCDTHLEQGDEVRALVRNAHSEKFYERKGVSVSKGELSDERLLVELFKGADVVYNCAGALGKWGKSSEELRKVNTEAAGFAVHCASRAGAGMLIHVSTAGVSGPLPDGVRADEEYPCRPETDYQKTKLAGEEAALAAHRETGLPLSIVRPAFVYGPGDGHKLSLFNAVAGRKIILVNGGRSTLHPVYVDDVVRGLMLAVSRAPKLGETYIIAGPNPATTCELLESIASASGVASPRFSLSEGLLLRLSAVAEGIGRVMGKEPPLTRSKVKLFSENYAYSIDKAGRELGYRPSVGLEEGMKNTVEWYREHGFMRKLSTTSGSPPTVVAITGFSK